MAPKLYMNPMSAYTRPVLLLAQAIDLKMEEVFINSLTGETQTPEFKAINPQHCVPTLDDEGFILWESKAIVCYLVGKYGKDDKLYPKDLQKRAIIDRFLNFDTSILQRRFYECTIPVVFLNAKSLEPSRVASLMEGVSLLNLYLEGKQFATGNDITIADICLIPSITSIMAAGFNIKKFSNVTSWVDRCKAQMKGYDVAERGLKDFQNLFQPKLAGHV